MVVSVLNIPTEGESEADVALLSMHCRGGSCCWGAVARRTRWRGRPQAACSSTLPQHVKPGLELPLLKAGCGLPMCKQPSRRSASARIGVGRIPMVGAAGSHGRQMGVKKAKKKIRNAMASAVHSEEREVCGRGAVRSLLVAIQASRECCGRASHWRGACAWPLHC